MDWQQGRTNVGTVYRLLIRPFIPARQCALGGWPRELQGQVRTKKNNHHNRAEGQGLAKEP